MAAVVKPLDQRAVIVEANSPALTLLGPQGAWLPSTNTTLYTDGSYWVTNTNGARAELTFTGTEVWFYADKNSDHGTFNAMIDDGPTTTILGYNDQLVSQTLLFYARVEPGEHVLNLVNLEPKILGIDYFAYIPLEPSSSATPATSSTSPSEVLATPPPPASGRDHVSLTVGLALGLTVATLTLVLVVLLFLSCRRKRHAIAVSQRRELEPMAYRPNSISSGSVGSIEPLVLTNPLPSLWSASSSARRVRHALWGDSDLASARLSTHYSTVLGDATTTHYSTVVGDATTSRYSTVVGDATTSRYSTVVGDATTIRSPVPAYSPGLFHQSDHAPASLSSSKSKFVP